MRKTVDKILKILKCYEECYCNLYEEDKGVGGRRVIDRDHVLFDVFHILKTKCLVRVIGK